MQQTNCWASSLHMLVSIISVVYASNTYPTFRTKTSYKLAKKITNNSTTSNCHTQICPCTCHSDALRFLPIVKAFIVESSLPRAMDSWDQPTANSLNTHTHIQPFNSLLSRTTQVGRYQKKHSTAHTHPDHRTSFIIFLHLQQSMASSLFSLRAWQSSRTTSLQVLFGLPLGLGP